MLENREVNSIIPSYVMKGNLVDSTIHAAMLDAMGGALQVNNHVFITIYNQLLCRYTLQQIWLCGVDRLC